jgi:hypothetical protein
MELRTSNHTLPTVFGHMALCRRIDHTRREYKVTVMFRYLYNFKVSANSISKISAVVEPTVQPVEQHLSSPNIHTATIKCVLESTCL